MSGLPEKLTRTILELVKKYLDEDYRPNLGRVRGTLGTGHGGTGGAAGSHPTGPAGGDLYGTYPAPQVGGIRELPVTTAAPSDGEFLMWDAGVAKLVWRPATTTTPTDGVTDSGILVTDDGSYVIDT